MGEFRCFNNNKIEINSTLNINLSSGNTAAPNCEMLVVPHNTVNLLGRDIPKILRLQLSQTKKGEKNTNFITIENQKITHKIFKNLTAYVPAWEDRKIA